MSEVKKIVFTTEEKYAELKKNGQLDFDTKYVLDLESVKGVTKNQLEDLSSLFNEVNNPDLKIPITTLLREAFDKKYNFDLNSLGFPNKVTGKAGTTIKDFTNGVIDQIKDVIVIKNQKGDIIPYEKWSGFQLPEGTEAILFYKIINPEGESITVGLRSGLDELAEIINMLDVSSIPTVNFFDIEGTSVYDSIKSSIPAGQLNIKIYDNNYDVTSINENELAILTNDGSSFAGNGFNRSLLSVEKNFAIVNNSLTKIYDKDNDEFVPITSEIDPMYKLTQLTNKLSRVANFNKYTQDIIDRYQAWGLQIMGNTNYVKVVNGNENLSNNDIIDLREYHGCNLEWIKTVPLQNKIFILSSICTMDVLKYIVSNSNNTIILLNHSLKDSITTSTEESIVEMINNFQASLYDNFPIINNDFNSLYFLNYKTDGGYLWMVPIKVVNSEVQAKLDSLKKVIQPLLN